MSEPTQLESRQPGGQDYVSLFYISLFGRAPDANGFEYWTSKLETIKLFSGNDALALSMVVDGMRLSTEYVALYEGLTPEQQVNRLYQNLFSRDADPDGLAFWSNKIVQGQMAFTDIAYLVGALAFIGGAGINPNDTALLRNKVDISKYLAYELGTNNGEVIQNAFDGLTANPASLAVARESIFRQLNPIEEPEPESPANNSSSPGPAPDTTAPTFTFTVPIKETLSITSSESGTATLVSGATTLETVSLASPNTAYTMSLTAQNSETTAQLKVADSAGNTTTSPQVVMLGTASDDTMGSATSADYLFGFGGNDSIQADPSADTFLSGGAGNDSLIGISGNDTLMGDEGEDELTGGEGADLLAGGWGNDKYFYGWPNEVSTDNIVEGIAGGIDRIVATVGIDFSGLTVNGAADLDGRANTDEGIEEIVLKGGATSTFTGAQLTGNTIAINESDNSGNTTLTVVVAAGSAVDLSDLTFAAVDAGAGAEAFDDGFDQIIINSVAGNTAENITGTSIADSISGDDGDDIIDGGSGNDSIDGGSGNDTITGGLGVDTLLGGDGNDVFIVVRAGDHYSTESIVGGNGTDEIRITDSTHLATFTALSSTSVERIILSDAYGSTAGTNVSVIDVSNMLASENVELVGNDGFNTLIGNEGNNIIEGRGGADDIYGGAGTDSLDGGDGNDTIRGGEGADSITGGDGTDTISYQDVTGTNSHGLANIAGMAINLSAAAITASTIDNAMGSGIVIGGGNGDGNVGIDLAAGTVGYLATSVAGSTDTMVRDNVTAVESVIGSELGDYIVLSNISGSVSAGNGHDYIIGGSGNDVIAGQGGSDTITGGAGADVLTGGAGADTFVYTTDLDSRADITDEITDFTISEDVLQFKTSLLVNDVPVANAVDVSSVAGQQSGTISAYVTDGVVVLTGANAAAIDTKAEALAVLGRVVGITDAAGEQSGIVAIEAGGNTYVAYFDDGALDGIFASENIVQLTGVTGLTDIGWAAAANTLVII